ncbi:hypothetical protein JIN85_16880 [Luteolibacter pohnpeiensis]|uniref:Uncharacterized protein n=1 Tax=Luteolibacter pohnpeiensis TaxID=454153 RepID=A0A934SDF4_9BACT|nr:hypothetical protein [Luteolibacter pohnpeiensis]MBK1884097.1 hypothetical protein [Luteolibacter pohnpeiensis]
MPDDGASIVLLNYGELMDKEPTFPTQADAVSRSPIGARWGRNRASGGAQRSLTWSRWLICDDNNAARALQFSHPAILPYEQDGTLRFTIQGGDTWEIKDAVLLGCNPEILEKIPFAVRMSYSARGGVTRPISEITLFPGITPNWINQAPSAISQAPSAL